MGGWRDRYLHSFYLLTTHPPTPLPPSPNPTYDPIPKVMEAPRNVSWTFDRAIGSPPFPIFPKIFLAIVFYFNDLSFAWYTTFGTTFGRYAQPFRAAIGIWRFAARGSCAEDYAEFCTVIFR